MVIKIRDNLTPNSLPVTLSPTFDGLFTGSVVDISAVVTSAVVTSVAVEFAKL